MIINIFNLQEQLLSSREEFWNTRVEGNKLMWQALRSCCEAILNNDIELANAILQASNMTTSTGYVDECYDELGRLYNVPKYCYCDPVEITSFYKTCVLAESTKSEAPASLVPKDIPIIPSELNDLKIRIRVNPGEINIALDCYSGQSVLDLKRMITKHLHQRVSYFCIELPTHCLTNLYTLFSGSRTTKWTKYPRC